jgi:AAA domain
MKGTAMTQENSHEQFYHNGTSASIPHSANTDLQAEQNPASINNLPYDQANDAVVIAAVSKKTLLELVIVIKDMPKSLTHKDLENLELMRDTALEILLEGRYDWDDEKTIEFFAHIRARDLRLYHKVEECMERDFGWSYARMADYRRIIDTYLAEHPELATRQTDTSRRRNGQTPPKSIVWQRASELQHEELEPLRWCIEGLVAEGLIVLAGRPKRGKSLLALNIALAKASGGMALGHFPAGEAGDVAFLCLEDGKRRIKTRIEQLMPPDDAWPERLWLTYSSPRQDEGLIRAAHRVGETGR